MTQFSKNYLRKLLNFFKDEKGTASIEFAFIAPILVLTYFATAELSSAFLAKEKAESVSETVSDLVAQGETITTTQLEDIFALTKSILPPSIEAEINIVVSAIRTLPDPNGNPETKVTWSSSKTGSDLRNTGDIYDELPDGMAVNFETLIITDLVYTYTAPFGMVIKAPNLFNRTFINRPRRSNDIPCMDC